MLFADNGYARKTWICRKSRLSCEIFESVYPNIICASRNTSIRCATEVTGIHLFSELLIPQGAQGPQRLETKHTHHEEFRHAMSAQGEHKHKGQQSASNPQSGCMRQTY